MFGVAYICRCIRFVVRICYAGKSELVGGGFHCISFRSYCIDRKHGKNRCDWTMLSMAERRFSTEILSRLSRLFYDFDCCRNVRVLSLLSSVAHTGRPSFRSSNSPATKWLIWCY